MGLPGRARPIMASPRLLWRGGQVREKPAPAAWTRLPLIRKALDRGGTLGHLFLQSLGQLQQVVLVGDLLVLEFAELGARGLLLLDQGMVPVGLLPGIVLQVLIQHRLQRRRNFLLGTGLQNQRLHERWQKLQVRPEPWAWSPMPQPEVRAGAVACVCRRRLRRRFGTPWRLPSRPCGDLDCPDPLSQFGSDACPGP